MTELVFTSSTRGVRIHRPTCKRATGALPIEDMNRQEVKVSKPATCCRPTHLDVERGLIRALNRINKDTVEVEAPLSPTCPRCGEYRINVDRPVMNALSRKDSSTYVCSPCGTDEAMLNLAGGREADVWPGYPGQMPDKELDLYEITVSFADSRVSKHYWRAFGADGGTLVAHATGVEVEYDNKNMVLALTSVDVGLLSTAAQNIVDMWTLGFAEFKTWRKTDEAYKALPSQVTKWVTSERYAREQEWLREYARNTAAELPLGGLL